MRRLAVLADLHIGAPARGHAEGEDTEAAYAVFARVADEVLALAPDAVLIAGDVFDRAVATDRALAAFGGLVSALADSDTPIVAVSGNHDAESPLPARLLAPPQLRWLSADSAETVVLEDLGLAVHGQSVAARDELRDLASGYPEALAGLVNIGLLHTSLSGEWSRRVCAATDLSTLRGHGYEAWALGHVHERMQLSAEPLVFYPGQPTASASGVAVLEVTPDGHVALGESVASEH